jgi:hypothetical protein
MSALRLKCHDPLASCGLKKISARHYVKAEQERAAKVEEDRRTALEAGAYTRPPLSST